MFGQGGADSVLSQTSSDTDSGQILSQKWILLPYLPTFSILLIFGFVTWIRFTHGREKGGQEGEREGRQTLTWYWLLVL